MSQKLRIVLIIHSNLFIVWFISGGHVNESLYANINIYGYLVRSEYLYYVNFTNRKLIDFFFRWNEM